jgi:signal peptidase II
MNKTKGLWLLVSLLIVVLDQWSKSLVMHHLMPGDSIYISPFLNIILSYNNGAAFGFFNQTGGWQIYALTIFSFLVSLLLLVGLLCTSRSQKWLSLALSLILGGAFGNLIDRFRLRYVIDFIDFHFRSWHFATFNVADSAVTIGVVLLFIIWIFQKNTGDMHENITR